MIFPEEWGPPPAFGVAEVSAEGEMRRRADEEKAENESNSSRNVCRSAEDTHGAVHAHAQDAAPKLSFYTVEGCPSASSDLLVKEGEYEGGFSIWECTWDLLGYFQKNQSIQNAVAGRHVMELGCGHGLLGIWAMQKGASAVVFQDLNDKVLEAATRWNILKNVKKSLEGEKPNSCHLSAAVEEERVTEKNGSLDHDSKGVYLSDKQKKEMVLLGGRVLCLSAEWEHMPEISCSCQKLSANCRKIQFEALFCAEGIYRDQTFMPLTKSIIQLLSPQGLALIASKRYYFGIGGGSLAFMQFLKSNFSQDLTVEVACTFKGPTSNNFRDVLLIRKKAKI